MFIIFYQKNGGLVGNITFEPAGYKRVAEDTVQEDRPTKRSKIEVETKTKTKKNRFLVEYPHCQNQLISTAYRIYHAIEVSTYFANLARMYEWDWNNVNFEQTNHKVDQELSFIQSQMVKADTRPILENALMAASKRIGARFTPLRQSLVEKINNLLNPYIYFETSLCSQAGDSIEIENCPPNDTDVVLFMDLAHGKIEKYLVNYIRAKNLLEKRCRLYEQANMIAAEFVHLAQSSNVKNKAISNFLRINNRFILSQTEDPDTAPILQTALLALSERISYDASDIADHDMAHKLMSLARGIFDPEPKPDWEWLTDDVWSYHILTQLLREEGMRGIRSCIFVSKKWSKLALQVHKDWVSIKAISLRIYGCKTAKEAVKCVIDRKLTSANLESFPDLTDEDLEKLAQNCPNLSKLFVNSAKISTNPISKLTQLTSLNLSGCHQITGDELANSLASLTRLTSLNLAFCQQIPGDQLADALASLTELTSLDLSGCQQIPGDQLANALATLTQLTSLDLSRCTQIPEDQLAKSLTKLTHLTSLNLSGCTQIPNVILLREMFPGTTINTYY